ncbi:MAG TPA: lysylphosphatidylglycerol synthase transmembrane domain-containing protein [Anaerolineae bacterium]|nr:lysylphosphatidylglycerol synthase transmembrane domain-containing protein [Anaerolineae bacterium]
MFRRWQFWLSLIVSAAFLWLALRQLKLEEVFDILRAANYAWLLPGVAVYFVAVVARAWRWQTLLKPLKVVSARRLFPVVVIGYMGNNIYPARIGELLRAYVLRRNEKISISSSLATVIVERLFDGLVVLLFVFLVLPSAQAQWDLPEPMRALIAAGSLLFFAALVVFLALAARPDMASRVYGFLIVRLLPHRLRAPVGGLLDRFVTGLSALRDFRQVLVIFLITLVVWLVETTTYWLVMHAFPFEVPFATLMLMNGVANLVTTIPALPGYVGTFDLPGIAVLVAFGVDPEIATSYTLVLHAVLWLPITLLGLFYMVRQSLRWSDIRKAADWQDARAAAP